MHIENVKTIADLAYLLHLRESELIKMDPEHLYKTFQIAKPGTDEKRTIETPTENLKHILGQLSDSLQRLYSENKTAAAYGFVRTHEHDVDKRNIYTNAKKHLDKKYLVNMDFDNFFHQITTDKLRNLFNDYNLFAFLPETEELLTKLVTYHGRLPMGSPTSPSLSNFAAIPLDNELLLWCKFQNITYSRYVDDLSFSCDNPITDRHYNQMIDIMRSHRFEIDTNKTKWCGKKDVKEITGLIVGKKISIPDEFIEDFEKSIGKLSDVYSFSRHLPDQHVLEWIEKMKQMMQGRLAFVGFVYGKKHPVYLKLKKHLEFAKTAGEIEESLSWRYAGYDIH